MNVVNRRLMINESHVCRLCKLCDVREWNKELCEMDARKERMSFDC